MQYFTLIGGFLGFLLTLAVSILAEKDLAASVFNATIGCIVTALLFRGLHFSLEICSRQIIAQKARERDEQRAAEQAAAESAEHTPPQEPPKESQGSPA